LRSAEPVGVLRSGTPRRDLPSVTGRQLGYSPNMIQPPLLGVVNAASAVSARTLICRAPAVPPGYPMLSVYMAVRVRPFPKLPPLERPLTILGQFDILLYALRALVSRFRSSP
jgi:hypothetical protein